MPELTIGALAKRTGLTVRTLHHYDEIGLLTPSGRTEGGYRVYSDDDIARLERIVLLRSLGIPLTDIGAALQSDANSIVELLERQSAEVQARIDDATRLRARLEETLAQLRAHDYRDAEQALALIDAVMMFGRYFDDEQRQALRARAAEVGPERIREVEARWPDLIAEVRREMNSGTAPEDPHVLALAEEWQSLVDEFTNGRWDIASRAGRMMHAEAPVRRRIGLDADVMDYVARAMALLPVRNDGGARRTASP